MNTSDSPLYRFLEEIDHDFDPPISKGISLKEYHSKISKNAFVTTISDKGEIKGFLAAYCNDPEKKQAFLSLIYVKKEYRSLGLGKELIRLLIRYLERTGFASLGLEVYKTNQHATDFYLKLGFIVTKENAGSRFLNLNILHDENG